MDKSSGNKKQSPTGGASRRAYGIFGGIINLAQNSTTKSNAVVPSSSSTPGSSSSGGGGGGDPPGSSNVYTVTVTSSLSPPNCVPTMAKTYENVAAMKKKKTDHSSSIASSLTSNNSNSAHQGIKSNMGSGSKTSNTSWIGPASRSILTALNELAISDDIDPSQLAPSSTLNNSQSGIANNNSSLLSANPIHSTSHRPSKRNTGIYIPTKGFTSIEREAALKSQKNVAASTSSASLHPSTSPSLFYHSNSSSNSSLGLYANQKCATNSSGTRLKEGNELNPSALAPPQSCFSQGKFHPGYKSSQNNKESLGRKGAAKQRDRSKSRTPDWIWKMFQLTKQGKLEELQQSLQGLDPTLIRHLSDAKGNTIVHYAGRCKNVSILQWLVSVLGTQADEALNDHNQAGRTVILTALKKGRMECLQWLIQNSKSGENALNPSDGGRSLLHYAVSYGNINVVRWVCRELMNRGIHVDLRDSGGMTPLHVAAKSGRLPLCHELVQAGADPLAETELGWRPSDVAIRHRHMECASYFMVAEAAGSLGNQLHSISVVFNHFRQQHEELRSHFRETLRVGKWLAKERNDLIKHFPSKLSQESTASTLLLGGANNGTRFSDMEHKLVLAEQAWKKISQSEDDANETQLNEDGPVLNISSQDLLQRRLAAVQLRHERNQSLGNSQSVYSDEEDLHEENSSLSDASSSDTNVDCVTTNIAAGSPALLNSSSTITHSANVSPLLEQSTMKARSKAAPWLLPPNDAFLSQLSPFVGTRPGRSLPSLDLLYGAPTSPSMLSPIMTPSSQPLGNAISTTDIIAGKSEKSLPQIDGEQHGQACSKKCDSLDISVLEVIEPTPHVSPSTLKNTRQAPDLICGTHLMTHVDRNPQQQSLLSSPASLLRSRQESKEYKCNLGDELIEPIKEESFYEPISPLAVMSEPSSLEKKSVKTNENSKLETFFKSSVAIDQGRGESVSKDKSRSYSSAGNKCGSEHMAGPCSSPSGPFLPSDNENECEFGERSSLKIAYNNEDSVVMVDLAAADSSSSKINFNPSPVNTALDHRSAMPGASSGIGMLGEKLVSKSLSPKSYVTKLTVIPAETSPEKCFLSMSCTSVVIQGDQQHQQQERGFHQLDLPGSNQEEISLGSMSSQIPCDSVSSSNTPVMPRFNSSGTVVFPLRKPDWNSTELLSQTTPDSSLAGRLSPTPSETSRTESTPAAPPSCVSHVSLNSEISKTESARGGDPTTPSLSNDDEVGNPPSSSFSSSFGVVVVEPEYNLKISSNSCPTTTTSVIVREKSLSDYSDVHKSGKKRNEESSSVGKKDDDYDNNDGSNRKQSEIFGNQVVPCFIRSHLSTGGSSSTSSGSRAYKPSAQQRLPKHSHVKGHRGHFKPWYEIEGSDDEEEGTLLLVTKSKSGYSSKFSSSSSNSVNNTTTSRSCSNGNQEKSRSSQQNEPEENNNRSGTEHEDENDNINQQPPQQQKVTTSENELNNSVNDKYSEFL